MLTLYRAMEEEGKFFKSMKVRTSGMLLQPATETIKIQGMIVAVDEVLGI